MSTFTDIDWKALVRRALGDEAGKPEPAYEFTGGAGKKVREFTTPIRYNPYTGAYE